LASEIAYHDNPRCNADSRLQFEALGCRQQADRIDQTQTRANGTLSIVFVSYGVSEESHYTVSEILRYRTTKASDLGSGAELKKSNDIALHLRIELCRHLTRPYKIAEQDRDLSTLRVRGELLCCLGLPFGSCPAVQL
jgi:hypothetical protein